MDSVAPGEDNDAKGVRVRFCNRDAGIVIV